MVCVKNHAEFLLARLEEAPEDSPPHHVHAEE